MPKASVWTPDREQEFIKIYNEGDMSYAEMALYFSQQTGKEVSRNAMSGIADRLRQRGLLGSKRPRPKGRHKKASLGLSSLLEFHGKAVPAPVVVTSEPLPDPIEPLPLPKLGPALPKSLDELSPLDCRYIEGDPQDPRPYACGYSKVPGSSYCEHHHAIMYPVSDEKEQKRDRKRMESLARWVA